jgi:hypothetical protein
MGPVRGRLIFFLGAVAGSPALAEVCDKMRPNFPTGLGRVSAVAEIAEALAVLLAPIGVIVILLWLASMFTRNFVPAVLTCLVAGLYGWIIWEDHKTEIWQAAIREGCAGNPILVFPALGLLSYFAIMAVIRRTRVTTGS